MMRVTHVSSMDVSGGAAKAAFRLHQGLRALGVESQMLVQDKLGDDPHVRGPSGNVAKAVGKLRPYVEQGFVRLFSGGCAPPAFSAQRISGSFRHRLKGMDSDVVHLHWICAGFVGIESLAGVTQPLVWTLHDMWPFTGGCHYDGQCGRYRECCGACPQLGSTRGKDLSGWIWKRKQRCWTGLDLTVVSPSRWMAECARDSSLFRDSRIEVIPNGIDAQVFRPMDPAVARERAGLPQNKKLALFSAMRATSDSRKGFSSLHAALKKLSETRRDVEALVLGAGEPENPPDFGMKAHYLGRCHDDLAIALVYASADVLIVPSEADNCPNTILEAMASGVPTVAFRVGGIPDLIRHKETGYLSAPRDPEDLCRGIEFVLGDPARWSALSRECRRRAVSEHDIALTAKRYAALYQDRLDERSRDG